jgi:hypothetical protein
MDRSTNIERDHHLTSGSRADDRDHTARSGKGSAGGTGSQMAALRDLAVRPALRVAVPFRAIAAS